MNSVPETQFSSRLRAREEQSGLADSDLIGLDRSEIYRRLQAIVGHTPVRRIELPNGNVLLQKLETENPTESHYDRCYTHLFQSLEEAGSISEGDTLLETSSGSAGVSFGWVASKLGFVPRVFMPSQIPEPRIVEARRFATSVHLSINRETYLLACAEAMMDYLREHRKKVEATGHRIWLPNHSQDFRTGDAFAQIAEEVCVDGQTVDYFIGGVGNGSTLFGVGGRLKRINPDVQVVGFEPARACPYYKRGRDEWGGVGPRFLKDDEIPQGWTFHDMPGTGTFGNITFPLMDEAISRGFIDDICPVPDGDILREVRYNEELPEEERQGNTSLVARFIAEQMAEKVKGKVFLTLAYDRADRYGEPRFIPIR